MTGIVDYELLLNAENAEPQITQETVENNALPLILTGTPSSSAAPAAVPTLSPEKGAPQSEPQIAISPSVLRKIKGIFSSKPQIPHSQSAPAAGPGASFPSAQQKPLAILPANPSPESNKHAGPSIIRRTGEAVASFFKPSEETLVQRREKGEHHNHRLLVNNACNDPKTSASDLCHLAENPRTDAKHLCNIVKHENANDDVYNAAYKNKNSDLETKKIIAKKTKDSQLIKNLITELQSMPNSITLSYQEKNDRNLLKSIGLGQDKTTSPEAHFTFEYTAVRLKIQQNQLIPVVL